jgi:hypothetical protein
MGIRKQSWVYTKRSATRYYIKKSPTMAGDFKYGYNPIY